MASALMTSVTSNAGIRVLSGSRASTRALGAPALHRRQLVRVRAESNPVKDIADKVDDAAKGLVDATKENSGLNEDILNSQPGSEREVDPGAFSFSGLLPEIINGRAAMVAMLAAFGAELRTGAPVFVQIQKAPVLIAAAFATVILASVAPVVRNADLNRNGAGPFTQRAEVYNGRLAMVAFALLIVVETWKAGPGLVP